MTTPEAKWAVFSATNPNRKDHDKEDGWKALTRIYSRHTTTSMNYDTLNEWTLLLALPTNWPDLCRLQACAYDHNISCSVKLFGEPMLDGTPEHLRDDKKKA